MTQALLHRLLAHLHELARPRHALWDPLGLMSVRACNHEQLATLGPVEKHHFQVGQEAGNNLILRVPGQNPRLEPLLIGTHYDGPWPEGSARATRSCG